MATSEKEINVYLLTQLDILEDALEIARKEEATDTAAYLEKAISRVNRKLYQRPSLEEK